MKEIIIRNNVNQIITITDEVKELGAKFVLINEKNAPIAWYVFDKEKFNNIKTIKLHTNDVRINFEQIKPSMSYEMYSLGK